jgi:hypothetical protein
MSDRTGVVVCCRARYYPLDRFPPKTFFALEEMLG